MLTRPQKLDRDSFIRTLRDAKPGAWITYYQGLLAVDRTSFRYDREERKRINEVARAAYSEYELGHVLLVKRRIASGSLDSPGMFEYIAVKLTGR